MPVRGAPLRLNPGKPVVLVESEKTAVICASLMPQFLWLATGGKSQLKAEKFAVLGSRKVTAFPDVDGFTEWTQKLMAQIDIADWLLRQHSAMPGPDRASPCHPERSEGSHDSRTFLDIQQYISPEVAGEVEALIEELGLEFFGKVERVEVEEDLPP